MFNVRYLCNVCEKVCQTAPGRTLHALARHRVRMTGRTIERAFNRSWGDLARYNTEVRGGVLHSPEMVESMRQKQAIYERTYREKVAHDGSEG